MKIKIIAFTVIMASVLSSCGTSATGFTTQSGQVPSFFKGYTGTLLVLKSNRAWNNAVEKKLEKNYTGKYLFVAQEDLIMPEYDNDEHRFLLAKSDYILYQMHGTAAAAMEDICVIDRKTERKSCSDQKTSMYGILIDNYTQALERIRNEK